MVDRLEALQVSSQIGSFTDQSSERCRSAVGAATSLELPSLVKVSVVFCSQVIYELQVSALPRALAEALEIVANARVVAFLLF